MPRTQALLRDIVIVDPRPDDYLPLLASAAVPGAIFHFATSAEDGMRLTSFAAALWLINLQLPDMSGIELCKLLRDTHPRLRGFLVSNVFSADVEYAARIKLSLPFVCKPARIEWLTSFAPPTITLSEMPALASKRLRY